MTIGIMLQLAKKSTGRREEVLLSHRVLIVEDAYFMRNLIRKAVREAGYEVVGEAKNGTEGIKLYFELKPDIVTMDINMPDISGIEVTRQILSKDPKAKIIAITGDSKDDVKQKMLEAGAKEYLKKPFQPAFLLTKIENMLQEQEEVVVTPTAEEVVLVDESPTLTKEVVDDFFEDMEIELLDKPDETRTKVLVVENNEDMIEFPEEYEVNEDEFALSPEHLEQEEADAETEDVEFDIPSSVLVDVSHEEVVKPTHLSTKEQVRELSQQHVLNPQPELKKVALSPQEEPILFPQTPQTHPYHLPEEEESLVSAKKEKEIVPSIQIRPPRGKAFPTESQTQLHDFDMEEPFIESLSDGTQRTTVEKQGLFGFMKKLFKK